MLTLELVDLSLRAECGVTTASRLDINSCYQECRTRERWKIMDAEKDDNDTS